MNERDKRIISSLILIPIAFFFIIKGSHYFIFFLSIISVISFYEWYQMTIKKHFLIPGFIFIILSFYSAYLLRGDNEQNLINFLVVIIICVSTDIGGYFFGKLFKGPKLTKISPKKTYAGFFGGFFLSIITYIIFVNNLEIFGFSNYKRVSTSLDFLFVIILISLVSQLGDIFVSYFKRLVKIKNTGKLIPGHGGLLDRIDGMIFAVPFAYLFLN